MTRARALGRRVAEAQDDSVRGGEALREARGRLLASPLPRSAPGRRWMWPASGAAAGLAVAAATLLLLQGRPAPRALAFEVGPSEPAAQLAARPGVVGEWIAAPALAPLPVHFSDGSEVRLDAASRARVVEVTSTGSRVLLESGNAHARVVHTGHTDWTVQAGPFEVHVVGTQFDVGWDPAREIFTLTLEEGQVTVSGCSLDGARTIKAGETFRAPCPNGRPPSLEPARPVAAAPPLAPVLVPSPAPPPPSLGPPPQSIAPPTAAAEPAPPPSWRALLARGSYAEAVAAADEAGYPGVCASADAATLLDLGDAARFAGRIDRADTALLEVRRRFPGEEAASVAAFDLGRIAFDDHAAYAEAARWFEQYVTERPSGALVREATGRRMEALERSGDHPGAREAAARYLRRFPSGPHADVARSIADR
jgi:transmembrane sensor